MAGFYLAIGLAVLTKGPVGLIPVPAALAYLAAARKLAFLRRSGAWWGAGLALLPIGFWMAVWGARAGHPFPIEAALARFGARVAVGLHHPHGPAHIFASLPLALVPWIVLLPAACRAVWPRRGEPHDERHLFVLAFPLVYAALFAMATEKRGVYLLPILPFQGLLLGRLWDQALFDWDPHPSDRAVRFGLLGGLLLAAAGASYALPRATAQDSALFAPGALLAAAAIGSALLPLLVQPRLGPGAAIGTYATGLGACYLIVLLVVLPAVDRHKSARPLAERAAEAAGSAPLGLYPDDHAGLAWYSRHPVVVLAKRDQLAAFLAERGAVCLLEERDWEMERLRLDPAVTELDRGQVGHRRFALVRSGTGP
jgi:4-amino-4-deoxy-L-arabinose transferase-like glycosyltransferase